MIKTCSLETAKKLKEAGFPQSSGKIYWHWVKFDDEKHVILWPNASEPDVVFAAAPTSDEILEELPFGAGWNKLRIVRLANGAYTVSYGLPPEFVNESLSEALAQMWLYLKQQGLLEAK